MDIKIFDTLNELNQSFTNLVKEVFEEKKQITVCLSGGSTPKSLFDYWAKNHKNDIDWARIKFFWGDERCVPPAHDESNYKMTKEHLFDHVPVSAENIFRIQGENSPQEEAKRYADVLKNEVELQNGIPSFDILMLGMGDDGHTASIFPHEIALWHSPEICVVGTHPLSGQKRVSLSGKTINAAKRVAFLVTGEAKAEKVKEIMNDSQASAKKYPAALVQPKSEKLYWFLDKKAGNQYMTAEQFSASVKKR